MILSKKAAAVAAGFVVLLVSAHQGPALSAQNVKATAQTLVLDGTNEATIDWIERSNVAALREGVVDTMELQIGMLAKKGKPIGYLHSEMAALTVKKAEVAARSVAPKAKGKAQQDLALAVVAINLRLNSRIKGSVSAEEMAKAEAELKVATAMILEAEEKIQLDEAELALARRSLEEHTIVSPFDGFVIERMKHPGESVRANEAVVKIGNLAKLRAYAYVPLEYAGRVKEGQIVEFQIRLAGERNNPLPLETRRFQGKVTFVDPQIQPVAETAVRIHAEFDNKDLELRPGYKGSLTIFLNTEGAPPVGARDKPAGIDR